MQAEISPAIRGRLVEAARRVAIRVHKNDDDPPRELVLVLVAAEFVTPMGRVPDLPEAHAEQAWSAYLEVREHLLAGYEDWTRARITYVGKASSDSSSRQDGGKS